MITLIEALDFRCLHHVRQTLGRFHVLVGPNASGKTTFLDIVSFLGDLVTHGPAEAIRARTQNFVDLLWGRQGESFQVAIEARLPERLIAPGSDRDTIRYEVQIGHDAARNELGIWTETVRLKSSEAHEPPQVSLFPALREVPKTILQPVDQQGTQVVVTKDRGGTYNFYAEILTDMGGKGWIPAFKLGPRRSALANLPEDETRFPAATWLKALLSGGVEKMVLDSQAMRRASPPGQSRAFKTDGSNLPWVVETLQTRDPGRFGDWIAHLQTALPDLEGIRTVERPDDRHRYLMLRYRGGLEVPSWTASDGTLRLLALTLLAYIPDLEGVYLIEEPENGVHPRAVETMYQSLSNVYDAQVLLANALADHLEPGRAITAAVLREGLGWGDRHRARHAAPDAQGLAGRDQPRDVVRRRRAGMTERPAPDPCRRPRSLRLASRGSLRRQPWSASIAKDVADGAQSGVLGGVQDARIARATGAAGCARP